MSKRVSIALRLGFWVLVLGSPVSSFAEELTPAQIAAGKDVLYSGIGKFWNGTRLLTEKMDELTAKGELKNAQDAEVAAAAALSAGSMSPERGELEAKLAEATKAREAAKKKYE